MNKKLQYINQGRGGSVVYSDDISEIKFDFEFGGGNCIAIIFIPPTKDWTTTTKRPIDDRIEILNYVATKATHDQVTNGYFTIHENCIEIYKSKE